MAEAMMIYSETLRNLKITYTTTNNEERKQAEKTLKGLEKDIFINFHFILSNLSVDPNLDSKIFLNNFSLQ